MNNFKTIFFFELKQEKKTSAIYLITLVAVFSFFVIIFYPFFIQEEEKMRAAFELLPKEYLLAFGFDLDNIFSLVGILGFAYSFVFMIVGIFSALLALNIFGKEKKDKCLDYLYSKPITRNTLFLSKLSAILLLNTLIFLGFLIFALFCYLLHPDGQFNVYLLIIYSTYFMMILISSVASLIAIVLKRIKSPGGIATGIGFLLYAIKALITMMEHDFWKYFSFFDYYNPVTLAQTKKYDTQLVILTFVVSLLSLAIAYYLTKTKDIKAV